MKRSKSLKKSSRTFRVLEEIDQALDFWLLMGTNQHAILKYGYSGVKAIQDAKERRAIRQAIRRLEEMELIEIKKVANAYKVKLLYDGAIQLFRIKVMNAKTLPGNVVCHVIFDIPETERALRDSLRFLLKSAGFTCVQRSVWSINKDVFQDLDMLFALKNVPEPWVRVYKSEPIV